MLVLEVGSAATDYLQTGGVRILASFFALYGPATSRLDQDISYDMTMYIS